MRVQSLENENEDLTQEIGKLRSRMEQQAADSMKETEELRSKLKRQKQVYIQN